MDTPVFWFRVVPAIVIIPFILFTFALFTRFVPSAIRRRDWVMIALLAFTYLLFGGVLIVAIHDVLHPPPL